MQETAQQRSIIHSVKFRQKRTQIGQNIRFNYDNINQLTSVEYADGKTVSYTYNNGVLTSVTDSNGTMQYTYDNMGMLDKKTLYDGTVIDYDYDTACNVSKITTPYSQTSYEYDLLGRITKVVDSDGHATLYEYDANGNRTAVRHANGMVTTYEYDSLNRLILETIKDSEGNTAQWYKYTLDTAGNRTKAEEYTGAVTEYRYDDCYRLTKETRIDNGISDVIEYTYDNMYNRLSKSENGVVTEYEYDANNRLIRQGEETLEYDNNGNLIRQYGGVNERTYTYNHDNRLVKAVVVQENNILSEEYEYDCEGSRISKITNEVDVTKYIVDSNTAYADVLAELDGDNNVKAVYTHGDEIISQKRNGTTSFYLFDGHGNTRMLADENGNITDTYTYDAFGNLINKTGETENNYLYCGEQYDGTTGYYYLRARYMNPHTGTFVTMDTYQGAINDPVSLHKYLYAGANPVMNVDPSGNMFFPIVDASVDKIKAAWDKMVVTIGYEQMAKIGIANSIATCLHQNISMMVLGENLLNLIAGKAPNKETKGVFGRGYSISGGLLIGASLQFLFVWDSQLNFGIAVTFNVGGAFGFSVNRDYMYFPTMETIYDLKGSGASAGLGFGIIGGEIEVSGGYIGGTVSIDFGGSFIRGKFFNQFWKDVTEASLGGNFSYTVLIFSYKTFDKK